MAEDELRKGLDETVAGWPALCEAAVARRMRGARADSTAGSEPAADPQAARPDGVVDLVATPDAPGVTPPRFFKRPAPEFTEDADRAHVVATVDLAVTFEADGTYGPVEVLRWAGFGLDESAISAVRACKFYPARKDGNPVAARALLRFNFRFRER
jgi:hypothetical protein